MVAELTDEKKALQERLEKVEHSKSRMERILKQNLGLKGTLKNDGSDILDEVALIMKRIDYLEQQSEDRNRNSGMEHTQCKREIQRLMDALEGERMDKARLLSKKNAEVSYFKSELDSLLGDMRTTIASKSMKRTTSIH